MSDQEMVEISRKKPPYIVGNHLRRYLRLYEREVNFSLHYEDLKDFSDSVALEDEEGNPTLWDTMIYPPSLRDDFDHALTKIYALLKTGGDERFVEHLTVERIDFCNFANSFPFRIKIVNQYNDNHDYFYVKNADASRIYGLELEHLLSPNNINFLTNHETLIEEHITGIPGDSFINEYMKQPGLNTVRIAKEFVKFNERCFIRLLGDMRAYNYVMDVTQDFDQAQYRVRAIDFDQQAYEGDIRVYLPQFHKENKPVVDLVWNLLTPDTIKQYQMEERVLMARRLKVAEERLRDLLDTMEYDKLSTEEKVHELAAGLAKFHNNDEFKSCTSMGELTRLNLEYYLNELL
jgi:hypothetical protein